MFQQKCHIWVDLATLWFEEGSTQLNVLEDTFYRILSVGGFYFDICSISSGSLDIPCFNYIILNHFTWKRPR